MKAQPTITMTSSVVPTAAKRQRPSRGPRGCSAAPAPSRGSAAAASESGSGPPSDCELLAPSRPAEGLPRGSGQRLLGKQQPHQRCGGERPARKP